jgi:diguanylate cyclase (GGDEF)-like protein/PAS domain S-box-containing protein
MSAQATAQIDFKRPEDSSSLSDKGLGDEARLKGGSPWRSLEIDSLRGRWQTAASASPALPPFEELTLDHLGGLADNVALVQMGEAHAFQILRAGKVFEIWINRPAQNLKITELSVDRARALQDLLDRAVNERQPVQIAAHGVVDGSVCTYDLVALPLANRLGPSLFLVYLQEREQKFSLVEAIFQATTEGLVALAVLRDQTGAPHDFQIAALNNGAACLMRGTAEELRGRRLSEIGAAFPADETLSRLIAVFNAGGSARFELDCRRDSGGQTNLSVSVSAIGDLVAMTLTDVSSLKAREESFRLLFEGNPVPMFLCDTQSLAFLAVNEAAILHYGYDRDNFLTLTLLDICPQEDRDHVRNSIRDKPDWGRGPHQPWQHIKADGSRIDVLTYWQTTMFRDRSAELVAIMDVTEKRRAETRIAYMAQHDALTGLPNRLLFHERLNEALVRLRRRDEKLAILYLDLDHFKNVNDTLGHPAGDLLLKAAADRLRLCLRDTDVVARFGGDEFAVLQMGLAGAHEASTLADRIVKLISEPFDIDGQRIVIGVSAGIAFAPNDGDSSDLLVRNADMALYEAKKEGRRVFRFFEPGMDARLRSRRALELDLRNALAASEFELYYQPLVILETGVISGFEALLRWRHPRRGMVPPAEFIPLAEEIGLIVPFGEWVLRQACAEAALWPGDLKVAVNLSPVQFKNGNVPQVVVSALANAGLPAARLELEVTESILLEESKINLTTLHKLRALGVSISMDDFGTGYSGMSYLRAFTFDKIKIDRSFVSELAESGDCMAIVRAIARLGTSLGIRTTAEGVETEEQLALVRSEGCTEMQGYLLSRPMPASEIVEFLTACISGWPPVESDLSTRARQNHREENEAVEAKRGFPFMASSGLAAQYDYQTPEAKFCSEPASDPNHQGEIG